jgi:hypothetical protein
MVLAPMQAKFETIRRQAGATNLAQIGRLHPSPT